MSLKLREEQRLRVLETRVLRRISGPKRDQMTGERQRLRNYELYALQSTSNMIRVNNIKRNEIGGTCGIVGERRNVYRVLVGRPE
jgi:hypothetical protein